MSYDTYLKCKHKTPEAFKNKYSNASALIIATGPSTKCLIKYKNKLKNNFDVIVGVNHSTVEFEDYLDFHVVIENNPTEIYGNMKRSKLYRRDLPRIINHLALMRYFPNDINGYKAVRHNFGGEPNIKKYRHNEVEGFFEGYTRICGRDMGTVTLQAIHFAGILGCNRIYIIGADGFFRDNDRYYTDFRGKKNMHGYTKVIVREPTLVTITHKGQKYKADEVYKRTADYINRFIDEACRPNNVEVFDFSDGLLTNAVQLDIDEFIK